MVGIMRSSGLVGKGMVLVGDRPAPALLAQTDRQTQASPGVLLQLFGGAAAEQGVRECDIVTRGDVERNDLEAGALP
jgi:hypothetical protein